MAFSRIGSIPARCMAAAASCFPGAVRAGAEGNPLYFILGGLFGLLLVQMFPQLLAYIAIFALLLSFQEYFPAIGLGTLLGLILVYLGGAEEITDRLRTVLLDLHFNVPGPGGFLLR